MEKNSSSRNDRTIVVPIDQETYTEIFDDSKKFREELDKIVNDHPELFPPEMKDGYSMKDIRHPVKLNVPIRRITVGSIPYTIRPAFVMPYHTALTKDAEKALFLRKFSVPFGR